MQHNNIFVLVTCESNGILTFEFIASEHQIQRIASNIFTSKNEDLRQVLRKIDQFTIEMKALVKHRHMTKSKSEANL